MPQGIEQAVTEDQLSVDFWRKRFADHYSKFASLAEMADLLAGKDSHFAGATGFLRLRNVHSKRAGLMLTARAVRLLDAHFNGAAAHD